MNICDGREGNFRATGLGSGSGCGAFSYKKEEESGILVITLSYNDEYIGRRMEIKVAPKEGSNLFSFKIDGHDMIYYDPTAPLADFVTGTPVLFPFPNRIENAMWTWKGQTYLHKKNGVPVQLHSMVYDDKSWGFLEPEIAADAVNLTTYIDIDKEHPIYRGYPFVCRLTLTYQLNREGLKVIYSVENKDNKEMPFGFALHPYFAKLSGDRETKVCVPCKYWYETRKDVEETFLCKRMGGFSQIPNILPTGELIDVETGGNNLKTEVPVGDIDLDHVFTDILEGQNAYIEYKSLKMQLNITGSNDFTHFVVFTPQGQPYFCIEPQTCSTDAVNLYEKGIEHVNLIIISGGQIHTGEVNFLPVYK